VTMRAPLAWIGDGLVWSEWPTIVQFLHWTKFTTLLELGVVYVASAAGVGAIIQDSCGPWVLVAPSVSHSSACRCVLSYNVDRGISIWCFQ